MALTNKEGQELKIEIAKNFLWDSIGKVTQSFLIKVCAMIEEERKALYVRKFEVFFEGDVKDGLITKEIARLYVPKSLNV